MLTSQFAGSYIGWLGKGTNTAMRKKKLLMLGLVCALAAVFAVKVRGEAAGEIGRLAGLMGWKAGTVPRLLGGQGAGDERRETTLKTGTRWTAASEAK
jgi:hypothetical protein